MLDLSFGFKIMNFDIIIGIKKNDYFGVMKICVGFGVTSKLEYVLMSFLKIHMSF